MPVQKNERCRARVQQDKRCDQKLKCCNPSNRVTHDVGQADLLSSACARSRVSGVRLTCSVELAYAEDRTDGVALRNETQQY